MLFGMTDEIGTDDNRSPSPPPVFLIHLVFIRLVLTMALLDKVKPVENISNSRGDK